MTPHNPPRRARAHHLARRSATLLVAATVISSTPLVAQALGDSPDETVPTTAAGRSVDVVTIHDRRPVSLLAVAGLDASGGSDAVDHSPSPVLRAAMENVRPAAVAPAVGQATSGSGTAATSDETGEPEASDDASPSRADSQRGTSAESTTGGSAEAASEPARSEAVRADGGATDADSEKAVDSEVAVKSEAKAETAPKPDPVEVATAVLTDTYAWDETGPRVLTLQEVLGVTADGWYGDETARAHRAALEFADLPTDTLPVAPVPPGPSPDRWAALRQCEAGGNYAITSSSGTYRGAYQFDQSTWNSVAGRHAPGLVGVDPAAAAPADQDALALALYHERGSSPWPHCGRHLG